MTETRKETLKESAECLTQNGQTKYLFTVVNSKVLCLVCRNVLSVPKEYNLRRHFETQHPILAELDANEKRLKA